MAMISKVQFILYYSMFLFFIVQVSALMGQTIIENSPPIPVIPSQPTVLDYITYPILNIGYFFQLMMISPTYVALGVVVFTPFVIAMLWAILELVRGV